MPDLTEQEAEWLARLPFTLRLRDSVCVVHAGLVPGVAVSASAVHNSLTHQVVVVEIAARTGPRECGCAKTLAAALHPQRPSGRPKSWQHSKQFRRWVAHWGC